MDGRELVLLENVNLRSSEFKYNKLNGVKHKNSRHLDLDVTYQIQKCIYAPQIILINPPMA